MAILRLVAKTSVVARKANGSSGVDIEKNTAMMSRSKTVPKRPSILVRSRSLSRPSRSGGRCLSLIKRTYYPSARADTHSSQLTSVRESQGRTMRLSIGSRYL